MQQTDFQLQNNRMTSLKQTFLSGLKDYVPAESLNIVADWLVHYRVRLTITHRRTTKLGDYRHPHNGKGHRITVNHNLNPYSFLVTLVHEIAHLTTWEKYEQGNDKQFFRLPNRHNAPGIYLSGNKAHRRIMPHGEEWKRELRNLMQPLFVLAVFPENISSALALYLNNPAASTCADPHLLKILRSYDKNKAGITLEELAHGLVFKLEGSGKVFRKGEKLRKRYKCRDVYSNKTYLVSGVAEVMVLQRH